MEVLAKSLCIQVRTWDLTGKVRFRSLVASIYPRAQGAILTYSTTDRASFLTIPEWMESIRQLAPKTAMILVGTKADLGSAREVSYCEGAQLAERLRVPFLETSAKACMHVEEAFYALLVLVGQGRFSTKFGFTKEAIR